MIVLELKAEDYKESKGLTGKLRNSHGFEPSIMPRQ